MTGLTPAESGWHATWAQLRAAVAGYGLLLAGVVLGRPDLVVLATPFVVLGLWAALTRPRTAPGVLATEGALTVHEGEEVTWQAGLSELPAGAVAVAVHPGQRWLEVEPVDGRMTAARDGRAEVRIALEPVRWGRRTLGGPVVAAYAGCFGWRWGPRPLDPLRLTVLPVTTPFDSAAPAPHPHGLVGMERAARPGEGTEFAKVRPFVRGDRLRRVHWPVSARTGQLHVTATYTDEDAQVVLLVDAVNDVGESGGRHGAHSSMDLTVRAAAVLAEHFLRRGDRVGLRVFGSWGARLVPAASGRLQLRRILDTLCLVEPGTARGEDALAARHRLGAGTLAIVLSPVMEPAATQHIAVLARAGLDVVVVDTLPSSAVIEGDDPAHALAWRLRMLERRAQLDRLESFGIPVVHWSGPHALDRVLRDLTHRAAMPRMAVR